MNRVAGRAQGGLRCVTYNCSARRPPVPFSHRPAAPAPPAPPRRRLATLSTKEEFPLTFSLSPTARSAPIIKEATTSNGVRLIARDNGASVRCFSH